MRIVLGLVLATVALGTPLQAEPRWTQERAQTWSSQQPWPAEVEFLKSITARPGR
jgi:hypothetical protein